MLYTPLDAAEGPLVVGAARRRQERWREGQWPYQLDGRHWSRAGGVGGGWGGSSDRIHRPNLAVNTVARVCEYGCE